MVRNDVNGAADPDSAAAAGAGTMTVSGTGGAGAASAAGGDDHAASGNNVNGSPHGDHDDHDHDGKHHGVHGFTGKWKDTVRATWNEIVPNEFQSMTSFAKYTPLIAAIVAPTSTLLDVPALSQPWYTFNGHSIKDPKGCIALSAIGLALNVIANILLIMRFSGTRRIWRKGTSLSLIFWIGKTVVAVFNVAFFGASRRNEPGYHYSEGFWCAVLSVIMAGTISLALLFHYCFAFGKIDIDDSQDLRLTGRKFMFSVTFFMFLLGLQGLAFNRLEGWSYLDAVYFSTQCALTIGYGDLVAKTAAGKVLVFVFSVLTISQLANEVSIIIDFVHSRSAQKRDVWRKKYSIAMHKQAIRRRPYATLIDEMSLIHQINLHQETMVQLFDLWWSGFSLASFWLIGSVIFKYVESWGYGNALYAVMVMSLTIGFGDFTPVTPAGRVIWVVYALMAVPIVTNFAVQTVGGIMYTWSEHRFTRTRFEMERERDPEVFAPHSHFILRHHEEWDDVREKFLETRDKALAQLKMYSKVRTASSRQTLEDMHYGIDDEDDNSHGTSVRGREPSGTGVVVTSPTTGTQSTASPGSAPMMSGSFVSSPVTMTPTTPSKRFPFPRAASSFVSALSSPGTKSSSKGTHGTSSRAPSSRGAQGTRPGKNVPRRTSSNLTPAEESVIGQMLEHPTAHDEVVAALGVPEIHGPSDIEGRVKPTRRATGKGGDGGGADSKSNDEDAPEDPEVEEYARHVVDRAMREADKHKEEGTDEEEEGPEGYKVADDDSEMENVVREADELADREERDSSSIRNTSSSTTQVDDQSKMADTAGLPDEACRQNQGKRVGPRVQVHHPDSDDELAAHRPETDDGDRGKRLRPTKSSPTKAFTRSETLGSRASRMNSVYDNTPAMGPQLVHTNEHGDEEADVELSGDPMVDSHRIELYLIKELVDRVTRLEAQSRQMLIDTMDKDVARTLLLADRNLQIRDAFQLYGNDIDLEKVYKEEADVTREDAEKRKAERQKELQRQAAVIADVTGSDENMLSRVRRYRNTFAEVLVLSSTLLKLEGDDLKRFERWHVGDLHHITHNVEADTDRKRLHRRPLRKRDRATRRLGRIVDWMTSRPEPESDPATTEKGAIERDKEDSRNGRRRPRFKMPKTDRMSILESIGGLPGRGGGGAAGSEYDYVPTDKSTGGSRRSWRQKSTTSGLPHAWTTGSIPGVSGLPNAQNAADVPRGEKGSRRPTLSRLRIGDDTPRDAAPCMIGVHDGTSLRSRTHSVHTIHSESAAESVHSETGSYHSVRAGAEHSPLHSSPASFHSPMPPASPEKPADSPERRPSHAREMPTGTPDRRPSHDLEHDDHDAGSDDEHGGTPRRRKHHGLLHGVHLRERAFEHHANKLLADTQEEARYLSDRFTQSIGNMIGKEAVKHHGKLGESTSDEIEATRMELEKLARRHSHGGPSARASASFDRRRSSGHAEQEQEEKEHVPLESEVPDHNPHQARLLGMKGISDLYADREKFLSHEHEREQLRREREAEEERRAKERLEKLKAERRRSSAAGGSGEGRRDSGTATGIGGQSADRRRGSGSADPRRGSAGERGRGDHGDHGDDGDAGGERRGSAGEPRGRPDTARDDGRDEKGNGGAGA